MAFGRMRTVFTRFGRAERKTNLAPRPRLIGLSMVKNEQDVIEPFLRHHAKLLDAVVVLDNASLDRTRAIALDCARELGNIVVGDTPEFSYLQSERMTRLLKSAQDAFLADYVFFLDADEFLSLSDREALLAAISPIPSGGAGLIPWRTFVIRSGEEDAVAADPPRNFTHRRSAEKPEFSKVVLRLDRQAATDIDVAQGNHTAARNDADIPSIPVNGLHLLHFPVRSRRQITAKAVVGWAACVARDPGAREKAECFQWRDAFDRLAAGGPDAVKDGLEASSVAYAQDPAAPGTMTELVADMPPAIPGRRYSDGSFAEPLGLIARSWEKSLSPVSVANRHAGSSPVRFIAEKYRVGRALLWGARAEALSALFDELEIPYVAMTDGSEPEGAFDLAVVLDVENVGMLPDRVVCERVLVSVGKVDRATDVSRWGEMGYAVEQFDTLGANALASDAAQQVGLAVLRRQRDPALAEPVPAHQLLSA